MAESSQSSTIRRLASGRADASRPSQLGRFELRRILGQGAQSVVWLAFDPRLEREVAIKLIKVGEGASIAAIPQWLQEARHVSRLSHPNIVPVFEADVQDLHPYLVFEYVPGQTLTELLAANGAMPAVEAADLMSDVLDALAVAHAAGVIHRDVKPSNILVDQSGRARVMDFGIAAPVQQPSGNGAAQAPAGTPGDMAPEVAQGGVATPAVDVFSAGMVLAEMLSGEPLVAERDPYRAIYRILNEPLVMRDDLAPEVDDTLRGIVSRAIARDPAQRHPGVRAFRDELMAWSARASGTGPQGAGGSHPTDVNVTLAFLLRRMRRTKDFPAMSDSVVRIQGIASSDTVSVASLTNEILRDVALTNKLLRLVNSAHFARGGGNISTVSRAVSLVGFNGIRNMALGLVLLEKMQDKAHAELLTLEFLRALMAASIARELSPVAADAEEAFIGAMFQDLGRLIAKFYFLKESQQVQALIERDPQRTTERAAAIRVLGLDYEALGLAVAKEWELPEDIRKYLRKPVGDPPLRAAADAQQRMLWITVAANQIAGTLLQWEHDQHAERLEPVYKRYARVVGISADALHEATTLARRRLTDLVLAMGVPVTRGNLADRLLVQAPPAAEGDHDESLMASLELPGHGAGQVSDVVRSADDILAAGIAEITQAMVEQCKPSDVVRLVLETMIRAKGFKRAVFCMRDPKGDALSGRFGLGEGMDTVLRGFHVPLGNGTGDLFQMVCAKGADTLIADATVPRVVQRLPDWYVKLINAPAFLLLPLVVGNKPLGLIYADMGHKDSLELKEKELALMRTLRNQIVMAFRHPHA